MNLRFFVDTEDQRTIGRRQIQADNVNASKLVFTTEAIENIPAGWRARETYIVHGLDEFEEIFELAEAGKGFELYSRARLKRVK